MANDYVEKRVKDALEESGGSASKAAQTLIEWALQDQMLLISLTQHHLKGIVSHTVDRAMSRKAPVIEQSAKNKKPAAKKPTPIDLPPESFGRDLLKALSGRDSVRFGLEGASGRPIVTHRKKASQQHIDILKSMSSHPKGD